MSTAVTKPKIDINAQKARFFSGIKSSRASMDANYVRPGHYLVRLNRVKADENRKSEPFVAIEMTVVKVFDGFDADQAPGKKAMRVGEDCSQLLMKKHEPFLPNLKAFIMATIASQEEMEALSEDQIINDILVPLCSEPCMLAGALIEITARNITTQKGGTFTRVNYNRVVTAQEGLTHLDEATQEKFFPNGQLKAIAQNEINQGIGPDGKAKAA